MSLKRLQILGMLLIALLAGCSAQPAPAPNPGTQVGAPQAASGIIIAIVVLAPESITAVRAAWHNQLQKSLNLALGSSLATIGLTIPAVAITNIFIGKQIEIGLSDRDTLLLALTLYLSLLTFGTGRTNILAGLVHLVVFVTFLFLVFIP